MTRQVPYGLYVGVALLLAPSLARAQGQRVSDLTTHEESVPTRLVGYGLVVGLDGTGDRSFGSALGVAPTVRSVTNLLARFDVIVPSRFLRLRNVAAVLVTAEAPPYLRPGGRFDLQVSSLGDATSLRGGELFMTPLTAGIGRPPVATAQGTLVLSQGQGQRSARSGGSGRVPDGGLLEVPIPMPDLDPQPRLHLQRPSAVLATQISDAINAALGDGVAAVEDPGAIQLNPPAGAADNLHGFLAVVDTISVLVPLERRLIVDARDGTVVVGGDLTVGPAVVSHRGITLTIGDQPQPEGSGAISAQAGATVQEVAAALHAAGASPGELSAIFEALREVGALAAAVVIR